MTDANIELTAELVAKYVSRNNVAAADMPALIQTIHKTLNTFGEPPIEAPAERPEPAVPIRRSITPDYIISLFDGRRLKSMKRYLRTNHNMSPDQYRDYWGLPRDYPMVAANYSATRSQMAKALGLGNRTGVRRRAKGKVKP